MGWFELAGAAVFSISSLISGSGVGSSTLLLLCEGIFAVRSPRLWKRLRCITWLAGGRGGEGYASGAVTPSPQFSEASSQRRADWHREMASQRKQKDKGCLCRAKECCSERGIFLRPGD